MENDHTTLGQRVKITRLELGLRQQDLADAAGVSTAAISQLEAGGTKNLRLPHFFALVDLLKVNPRWLALGKGPRFMKAAMLALVALTATLGPTEPNAAVLHKNNYQPSGILIIGQWLKRLILMVLEPLVVKLRTTR